VIAGGKRKKEGLLTKSGAGGLVSGWSEERRPGSGRLKNRHHVVAAVAFLWSC